MALRTPATGDPAYAGMEIQFLDDENWEKVHKFKLADFQRTGSIYRVQQPKATANKKIGEWNSVRIVCEGRKVVVEHNGKEIQNANLDNLKAKFDMHPGLKREKGHVALQSNGTARVEFRSIYVRELK